MKIEEDVNGDIWEVSNDEERINGPEREESSPAREIERELEPVNK